MNIEGACRMIIVISSEKLRSNRARLFRIPWQREQKRSWDYNNCRINGLIEEKITQRKRKYKIYIKILNLDAQATERKFKFYS